MSTEAGGSDLEGALGSLRSQLLAVGRDDLAEEVRVARTRLERPATVVCVVGEYKQGKSSLVNGLLGSGVCPVDDDLATSVITLVRRSAEPGAAARYRAGTDRTAERIPIGQLHEWVTEAGNADNARQLDRVDVGVPAPILETGLTLVDTPGVGGLAAGPAAATLAFLPFADGVVLVSDASAELTASEMAFLAAARERCPNVVLAQTKIDAYPSWRRIVERNVAHLEVAGIDVPVVPLSSRLRMAAFATGDADLNRRSGYRGLLQRLDADVVRPAKEAAAVRARADAVRSITLAEGPITAELAAMRDEGRRAELVQRAEVAAARLEHLRGPGARWATLVNDQVTDLTARVNHDLRTNLRAATRDFDERIEKLVTGRQWDSYSSELQARVAEVVGAAFVAIESARAGIRAAVVALLAEDEIGPPPVEGQVRAIDVASFWTARSITSSEQGAGQAFRTSLSSLRGAYGGMAMFGMLGSFAPAAAAGVVATNPVLLGVGAAFGAIQLLDDRKRRVAARRQVARVQVRQFIDDVQLHAGDAVGDATREVQRSLRDEFTARLGELQRSHADAARSAQAALQASDADAASRGAELERALAAFGGLRTQLEAGAA